LSAGNVELIHTPQSARYRQFQQTCCSSLSTYGQQEVCKQYPILDYHSRCRRLIGRTLFDYSLLYFPCVTRGRCIYYCGVRPEECRLPECRPRARLGRPLRHRRHCRGSSPGHSVDIVGLLVDRRVRPPTRDHWRCWRLLLSCRPAVRTRSGSRRLRSTRPPLSVPPHPHFPDS
jgi:hypothetical protein